MIQIENLSYAYGSGQKALDGINLDIGKGEFVLLTGNSGSGKSTLVRCLNGIVPNFYGGRLCGSVLVNGKKVTSTKEMARTISMLFQDPESMFLSTTVKKEIGLTAATLARTSLVMKYLEITCLGDKSLSDLSGGEKQKVALASVLAPKPKILILDEPLSELDKESSKYFLKVLKKLNKEGMTIILIEQRTEQVYKTVSREVVLGNGKVIYDGKPKKNGSYSPLEKIKKGDFLLTIDDLSFSYDGNPVFKSFSESFSEGELVVLEGNNGSGKTTLLKLIMGLLKPNSGQINLGGLINSKVEDLAGNVGYVFQNPDNHLFAETVGEEVEFILKNTSKVGDVDKILKLFGILHYKNSYPRYLSGGEKQRVALASILVAKPKILLLDEPTRGMDHNLKQELEKYLIDYAKEGNLVIMATHDEYMANCATRRIKL